MTDVIIGSSTLLGLLEFIGSQIRYRLNPVVNLQWLTQRCGATLQCYREALREKKPHRTMLCRRNKLRRTGRRIENSGIV